MTVGPGVRVPIMCQECFQPWLDEQRGWQAHRLDEGFSEPERNLRVGEQVIAFYCPECAEREFGEE